MGRSASTGDPRFRANPITSDELKELDIEISVLSELELTDEPMSLRLGVDGIYIKRGMASGCFLPQVAEETGWSKEEFLSYCCAHKAGLRPDAWKEKDTEVYLFTAEIFGANFSEI
jgi:AmmeMemoRadiSam system protein A